MDLNDINKWEETSYQEYLVKQKLQKLRPMPNTLISSNKPLTNWRPLFTLGDATQLVAARNHFAEFIGYVGVKDKDGNITLDPKNGVIHRGQAFPPPINKEGKYCGVLDYELDTFELLFMHIEVMLKWAREHGKTFMATWFIEWSMIYCGKIWLDEEGIPLLDDEGNETIVPESWLYFSVTKIKAKVGFWVYRWALKYNYITRVSKQGSKQNTYTNFELTNGAMMQIHDFMSEDPIGEHNWNFALDDIVKKKWQDRPSDNQKAKDQWDILNYIGHVRVFVFGTKKYIGDPLEYLENVLSDLVIDVKTPFVMEGDFPTWKPKFGDDGREILIAPELHTHEELYKKRNASKRAWMAEEMQDPMAFGSKVWDHVNYIPMLEDPYVSHYETMFIYLDRATTTGRKSDFTGCLIGVREIKTGRRIIIDDWTQKIPMEYLLFDLCVYVMNFAKKYPHMKIRIILEQQGGGSDFDSAIQLRSEFEKIIHDEEGKPIMDKEGKIISKKVKNVLRNYRRVMVHNTGDKGKRIEDRVETPLKNAETGIVFVSALRGSEIVYEILNYPNINKIDALDALATGDWELQLHFPLDAADNNYEGVMKAFVQFGKARDKRVAKEGEYVFEVQDNKELEDIKAGIKKRNKGVFG